MTLEERLFNLGVPLYTQDIITNIPVQASQTIQIAKTLPTTVGWIFGISVYTDGVDSANNTLISTTQAQNLYMYLQNGPVQFLQEMRLSDFLNDYAGSPIVRIARYFPVNIPGNFDLSTSQFLNPTAIASTANQPPIVIRLKLYYIDKTSYKVLEESGAVAVLESGKLVFKNKK